MVRSLLFVIVLLFGSVALACDCASVGSPKEHVENTPIIAYGVNTTARVLTTSEQDALFPDESGFLSEPLAVATFKVEIAIKGAKTGDLRFLVRTSRSFVTVASTNIWRYSKNFQDMIFLANCASLKFPSTQTHQCRARCRQAHRPLQTPPDRPARKPSARCGLRD